MPTLHELQWAFGTALLGGASTGIEPYVRANGIEPAARLRIYRNNTREQFLAPLRAEFPVLERLVGEDYFRQLALEYRDDHPSRSGNLHHVGERLSEFLARKFNETEYRYFPDVARLEWAYQEVLIAADHVGLDFDRLQSVEVDDYPRLVFRLHPAVRLVASTFPVLTIWSANQPGADTSQRIDLDSGGERVLIVRTASDVELRRLDAADFTFLASFAAGAALSEAAAAATNSGEFDTGASLRRYVAANVLVDFTLPEPDLNPGDPS